MGSVFEKASVMVVPIEFLWEGLALPEDVYSKDGTILLIPRGEVLTAGRLEKLWNDPRNRYVATGVRAYQAITQGSPGMEEVRRRRLEDETGYTGMRLGMEDLIREAPRQKVVQKRQADAVMNDVFSKLKHLKLTEIFSCIDTPRPMDERLQRHCLNVGILNGIIGQWMELKEDEIKLLIVIGVLHDIGKTKIPEEILNAPRKLTPEEFEIIKNHPVYSYELLGDGFDERVRHGVLYHHERLDGSGYPEGLKGDEIDLFARITSVSDVYDAMVSARSYKGARIPFDILNQFMQAEHRGLDLEVTTLFTYHMIQYFRGQKVEMSDGSKGNVVFIPPNDINHPIVRAGDTIKQVDEEWYCEHIEA
jgi:HD-GYP domain-containing protein (c-di-GMP phosphodiesterase class II)